MLHLLVYIIDKLSVTTGLFYSCYITHEKIIVLLHLDVYNTINYV